MKPVFYNIFNKELYFYDPPEKKYVKKYSNIEYIKYYICQNVVVCNDGQIFCRTFNIISKKIYKR